MKKLALLGSTGSIGVQTLSLVEEFRDFEVELLAAGKNSDLLLKQIIKFKPRLVYVNDKQALDKICNNIDLPTETKVFGDIEILLEALAANNYDVIVNAVVGMAGIRPTLAAVAAGKKVAIANKETLVCAGHILMPLAEKTGAALIPIDSEHSAIAQCLTGEAVDSVDSLILTASGGPFYNKSLDELKNVGIDEALAHPNWRMGAKISIDSATMVNKALEVMEAHHLFGMEINRIKVLIHPSSIVHSMVCFRDGAIKAQLGLPDMKLPIAYAVYGYNRRDFSSRLNLANMKLEFFEVDLRQFKAFGLGLEAAGIGGSMPTVFNAANELAVRKFLSKEIGFLQISELIEDIMQKHIVIENPSINDILDIEEKILK